MIFEEVRNLSLLIIKKKEINFGEPEACVTLGRQRTFRGLSLKIN